MRGLRAAFLVATLAICSASGRICRSGFNTSIYGIPIAFWDESDSCSTFSSQSCFLGEITLDTSFFEDDVSLTYGSCISSAYESTLECDNLFYGKGGLNADTILALLPDLQSQFGNAIAGFSEHAAQKIIELLRNENGQLDSIKVTEAILNAAKVAIPENVKPVITKLDTLILTAMLNVSEVNSAADEFLASFGELDTTDAAASNLLYGVFTRTNLEVPEKFKPMIDNLPGFVSYFLQEIPGYVDVNSTLFNVISKIDNTPKSAGESVAALLKGMVPKQYNLDKFFDLIPSLVDELAKGNFDYLNEWNLNALMSYSRITPATQAMSNSTFQLIKRIGFYENLTSEIKTVITYLPGYYYNFFPDSSGLELAFFNISQILDSMDPNNVDINAILRLYGVDTSVLDQSSVVSTLNAVFDLIMTQNVTEFGIQSLEALEEASTVTLASMNMSNAILQNLKMQGVATNPAVEKIIIQLPGIFITAFSEDQDMIDMMYASVAENLNKIDYSNPDYAAIVKSAFEPLKIFNLTADDTVFGQLSTIIDFSDPVGSLRAGIELITEFLPPEMNQTLLVLNPLPDILGQLLQNMMTSDMGQIDDLYPTLNFDFILDILPSFGVDTSRPGVAPAISTLNAIYNAIMSQNLTQFRIETIQALKDASAMTPQGTQMSNSILVFLKSLNVSLPDGVSDVILSLPGLFVTAFPKNVEMINMIYANISNNLDQFDPFNPNFEFIRESALAALKMIAFPPEFDTRLLEQFVLTSDFSDPVVTLRNSLNIIKDFVPPEAQQILPVLDTVPELLNQLMQNKLEYLSTWGLETLKAYSRITPVTTRFSNSVFELMKRFGIYSNLTEEYKVLITYQPGIYYNYFYNGTSELEMALYNMSQIIDKISPTPNMDFMQILQMYPVDVTIPGISQAISTLNALFDLATTQDVTQFGIQAMNVLKEYSTSSPQSTELSNSMLQFFGKLNLTIDSPTEEIIMSMPGLFITAFPEYEEIFNMTYISISQNLDRHDPQSPTYGISLESILSPLQMLNLTDDVKILLQKFVQQIDLSNPVESLNKTIGLLAGFIPGENAVQLLNTLPELLNQLMQNNFEYATTWSVKLLKTYSKITPVTTRFSNSVFNLAKQFGFYENLTDEVKTFITYQVGYFYQLFSDIGQSSQNLDIAFGNISLILESIDPAKPVDLKQLLTLIAPDLVLDSGMESLISTVEGLIPVSMSGDADAIGRYGLEALKNYSKPTTESTELGNAITDFLTTLNVTLAEEFREMVRHLPGIFTAAFPDQLDQINAIFSNISQGLDSVEPSMENGIPDFSALMQSLVSQLETLNITFTAEAKSLIEDLPRKIDVSNPVSSVEAVLQIAKAVLPKEYNALTPLIDSLPALLRELLKGNAAYITSWQINLLKLYSITTPSTEAMSDSIFGLIDNLGYSEYINDDIRTWITYQPGYFYQFFPGQDGDLNSVFSKISLALDRIDPTQPNLEAFLLLFDGEIDLSGMTNVTEAVEEFLKATTTGNETLILTAVVEMMEKLSQMSTEGSELSQSIIDILEGANISLPAEAEDIIRSFPGVFLTFVPTQSETIRMIYDRTSKGIQDSLKNTFNIERIVNDTLLQLEMASVQVPPQVLVSVGYLQEFVNGFVLGYSWVEVTDQLANILPHISPPNTAASSALSKAMRHVLGQIEGFPMTKGINALIEFLPRIPFMTLPTNDTIVISVYTAMAENMLRFNVTHFDPSSVRGAFKELTPLAPEEVRPLLGSTEDMIIAAVTNDTSGLINWGAYLQDQYCESNTVTVDFSKAFYESMTETDLGIPGYVQSTFECIPGMLYNFMPNQTLILDEVFSQVTLMYTNTSAFVRAQFEKINVTMTPDLVALVDIWPEMQKSLMQGNVTRFMVLVQQFQSQLARETELSKLTTTILRKAGVDVTDDVRKYIRQASTSVYNPSLAKYFPTFDTIFSSLDSDITEGKSIGTALMDAFAKADVDVPHMNRAVPVLDNLESLIEATMSPDANAINDVILQIMISYNASFPSDQVQYSIAQYKLQITLQKMVAQNLQTVPDEAFEYMAEMYHLLLKMSNVTESYLKNILIETFPDGEAFVQIFFQLDPKDAFAIITDFATWLTTPERNPSVLASHITETLQLLFAGKDLEVGQLLSSIETPKSCKYGACQTDRCNTPGILDDVDTVTKATIPDDEDKVTEATTVYSTGVSITSNEATTVQAATTTSGHVINSKSGVNSNAAILGFILSAKWLLS